LSVKRPWDQKLRFIGSERSGKRKVVRGGRSRESRRMLSWRLGWLLRLNGRDLKADSTYFIGGISKRIQLLIEDEPESRTMGGP
jgi:hypothetical protein